MSAWIVGYVFITMAFGCLALGLGAFVMAPHPKSKHLKNSDTLTA